MGLGRTSLTRPFRSLREKTPEGVASLDTVCSEKACTWPNLISPSRRNCRPGILLHWSRVPWLRKMSPRLKTVLRSLRLWRRSTYRQCQFQHARVRRYCRYPRDADDYWGFSRYGHFKQSTKSLAQAFSLTNLIFECTRERSGWTKIKAEKVAL